MGALENEFQISQEWRTQQGKIAMHKISFLEI